MVVTRIRETRRLGLKRKPLTGAVFSWMLAGAALLAGCSSGTPLGSVRATANPLVAGMDVYLAAGSSAYVEFGTNLTYALRTAAVAAPAGGGTVPLLIAGMKPGTTYHLRTVVQRDDGSETRGPDQTFTTQALHFGATMPRFTVAGGLPAGSGIELVNVTNPKTLQALALDLQGNVIWYYNHDPDEGVVFPFKLLPNGHVLLAIKTILREVELDGAPVRQLQLADLNAELQRAGYAIRLIYLHHDFALLPNGHIVVICAIAKTFHNLPGYPGDTAVTGDALIDLDADWKPVWVWNAFDHLDVNRHPYITPQGFPDWSHCNAILYDRTDRNLIVSIRNQSWIVKIDYRDGAGSGDILWRLGYEGNFSLSDEPQSQWFFGQHYPAIISDSGRLLRLSMVDNGNQRVLDSAGDVCGAHGEPGCFSRALIMDVDQTTMSANIVWQFLPKAYSPWGGVSRELPDGNVEFELPMPIPLPGSRLWELPLTIHPLPVWTVGADDQTVYRAERVPSLYPGVTW
jgi:arylsulfate sulfotransferase